MINIVVPMAGAGSRFKKAGYEKPKPFIDVLGEAMIERVLNNLKCQNAKFILIAQKQHLECEKKLVEDIKTRFKAEFIGIDGLTEGTACTILKACNLIDNDSPLLIANSDQIVDIKIADFLEDARNRGLDGSILCFKDKEKNPKWSFARLDDDGFVSEVKEKQVISEFATVGIYYFARGSLFIKNAQKMIEANDRVNNEFYTAVVYNWAIKDGAKVGIYEMDFEQMHGLGTPDDLKKYIKLKENNQI